MRNYKPSEFISAMLHSDTIKVVKEEKPCAKCGKVKKLDEFYEHSTCGDGKTNTCKSCMTIVRAERKRKKKAENEIWNQYMPI